MNLRSVIRINKSFSARVFIYLSGAMIILVATFTFFYLHNQHKYLELEMIKDGRILAEISANSSRLGIFAQDRTIISNSLKTVVNVEGVAGACAYDVEGRLLHCDTVPGWQPEDICFKGNSIPVNFLPRLQNESGVMHVENEKSIDFWSPVLSRPQMYTEEMLFYDIEDNRQPGRMHIIGFVGVVLDKAPIQKSIREILIKNLLLLLLFLALGCVATYYIVRGVSRPIAELVEGIKSGPHAHDLRLAGSNDELGLLSSTYSDMIESLSNSFQTISELKEGLEVKVQELESEITKRRRIENDLRESEEKFRSISEGIADGVAIIFNGKFAWYNRAFCAIFGFRHEDLHDLAAEMLLPQADQMQTHLSGSEVSVRYLVEAKKQNGFPILLEVNAQKIIYERQGGVQIILRDITESAAAEQKRKELEVKLLGQSKLASLGKIATSVAHEINQPLSYIKIANEAILRDIKNQRLDPEEIQESCGESLRQIDRITFITNHLRTYGRADTTLFTEVRLSDVLANSLTLMGEGLRLADIELVQEIDDDLPPVTGNGVKLEQVLINLFQNSIDALTGCPENKFKITMRPAGGMAEIVFADTGPGIPPDVVEHIFEPFFTTKILEERSGLGLGIINSIVREHHGTIRYSPEEGWGARFLISLPVRS
jgi:PAS domain S-box-containing protein